VLELIPYGLYVLNSLNGSEPVAMVATWVTQVSFEPPLLAVALEEDSAMRSCVQGSQVFSVNFLFPGSVEFAKRFLRHRPTSGESWRSEFTLTSHGIPVLKAAKGSLACRVENSFPTGDHVTFVGKVVDAVRTAGGEILTLRETGWRYRR
jgi:flavin reductase (DIM6/NTAB) family NADH-FMN oxidoreductase RutF